MKRYIFRLLDFIRGIRGKYCTYWLKKQLVQYGDCVGAARVPRISRMAKVRVGSHASFNGFTVSGMGGGKYRFLLPFWNKCYNYAWKS